MSGSRLQVGYRAAMRIALFVSFAFIAACGGLGPNLECDNGQNKPQAPLFTLTSIDPATVIRPAERTQSFNVTVKGANLPETAVLKVGGDGVIVSNVIRVSSTTLTATFTISSTTTAGYKGVWTEFGALKSNEIPFTVTSRTAPTLTNIAPPSGVVGTEVPVALTGTNFVEGIAVEAVGITVSNVQVNSPTQLTATFSIPANAGVGETLVHVRLDDEISASVRFTILPAGLRLDSISPESEVVGSTFQMNLAGANFADGASIQISGTGVTVVPGSLVVVRQDFIRANLTIAANAPLGARTVTVVNGAATSNAKTFTVLAGRAPYLANVSPNEIPRGNSTQMTLTGADFVAGATVTAGSGVTVTNVNVVSPSEIRATFTVTPNATVGRREVKVSTQFGQSHSVNMTVF